MNRETNLDLQFVNPPLIVGGRRLRKLGAKIILLARKLNIKLIAGTPEEMKEINKDPDRVMRDIVAVHWLLSREDLAEATLAAELGTFASIIDSHSLELDLSELTQVSAYIAKINLQAQAASVQVEEKPKASGEGALPEPPKNS